MSSTGVRHTGHNSSWQVACVAFHQPPPVGKRAPNAIPCAIMTGIAPENHITHADFIDDGGSNFRVERAGTVSVKFGKGFRRRSVTSAPRCTPNLLQDNTHNNTSSRVETLNLEESDMSRPQTGYLRYTESGGLARFDDICSSRPQTSAFTRHKAFNPSLESSEGFKRAMTPGRYRESKDSAVLHATSPINNYTNNYIDNTNTAATGKGKVDILHAASPSSRYIDRAGPLTLGEGKVSLRNSMGRFFREISTRPSTASPTMLSTTPSAGLPYSHASIVVGLHKHDMRQNEVPSTGMRDQLDDAEYLLPLTVGLVKTAAGSTTNIMEREAVPTIPIARLREEKGIDNARTAISEAHAIRAHSITKHFDWDAPAVRATLYSTNPDPLLREEREEKEIRANHTANLIRAGRSAKLSSGPVLALHSTRSAKAPAVRTDYAEIAAVRALR